MRLFYVVAYRGSLETGLSSKIFLAQKSLTEKSDFLTFFLTGTLAAFFGMVFLGFSTAAVASFAGVEVPNSAIIAFKLAKHV